MQSKSWVAMMMLIWITHRSQLSLLLISSLTPQYHISPYYSLTALAAVVYAIKWWMTIRNFTCMCALTYSYVLRWNTYQYVHYSCSPDGLIIFSSTKIPPLHKTSFCSFACNCTCSTCSSWTSSISESVVQSAN